MEAEAEKHSSLSSAPRVSLSDLHVISVLGRGAKGLVFLALDPTTDQTLALKCVSRSFLLHKNPKSAQAQADKGSSSSSSRRIWHERDVLASLRHPLLPSLRGLVSTDKIVAFAIDLAAGGDLASLRRRQSEQMFSPDVIRFYAAELVLALSHLHRNRILYRDLKPENILIQGSGHIMLVDFDLSLKLSDPIQNQNPNPNPITKRKPHRRRRFLGCLSSNNSNVSPETSEPAEADTSARSNSFVGTEEYVAPEVITGKGHSYGVDWWSLGVVLYEMLYGRTPFRGQNRKETFFRILTKEPELTGEKTALRDLIGRLLDKDEKRRIGFEGIKGHAFFRGVDWERVMTVERPPFVGGGVEWEEEEEEGKRRGTLGIVDVEKCVEEVFGVGEVAAKVEGDPCQGADFAVF